MRKRYQHLNLSVAQDQELEKRSCPVIALRGRGGAGSPGAEEERTGSVHGGVCFANFGVWAQFYRTNAPPKQACLRLAWTRRAPQKTEAFVLQIVVFGRSFIDKRQKNRPVCG